jgi:hypothetical protein
MRRANMAIHRGEDKKTLVVSKAHTASLSTLGQVAQGAAVQERNGFHSNTTVASPKKMKNPIESVMNVVNTAEPKAGSRPERTIKVGAK